MIKITFNFEEAKGRVYLITGAKNQVDLADILCVAQSSISDAEKRHSIPASWLLALLYIYDVNPIWVLTGKGCMYLHGDDTQPQLVKSDDSVLIAEIMTETVVEILAGFGLALEVQQELKKVILEKTLARFRIKRAKLLMDAVA